MEIDYMFMILTLLNTFISVVIIWFSIGVGLMPLIYVIGRVYKSCVKYKTDIEPYGRYK